MSTYAETLLEFLQDKIVEIHIGDQYEKIGYSDNDKHVPAVLVGKLVAARGDVLVLDCLYKNKGSNKFTHGNLLYINGYNIKAVSELNGNGSIKDAIVSVNGSYTISK